MDRLADTAEHLDGALEDAGALAGNLRDLGRINRFLGGTSLSRRAVAALLPRNVESVSFLDVGTGGADIPLAMIEAWRRDGVAPRVVAIDSRAEVLAAAASIRPDVRRTPGFELRQADGLALPFADRSFDVVHTSLVLHHFEPQAAVRLLREMARVATRGVVVNDLSRGRLSWLGAWLMSHLLTRNPLTRDDAPLSVRRAYTLPEARRLLEQAGLRAVREEIGAFGHRWAVSAVVA
jgi:ubiquinone/menaquinone biosynthesis C-methylase UbiE